MKVLLSLLVCAAVSARAQNPPPPSQAQAALQQALQQNPGLGDVIRQRLQQSGMTPDQIRARLQASGYAANLLDAYLGTAKPGEPAAAPGAQELLAIQALGIPSITNQIVTLDTGVVRVAGPPSHV